MQDGEPHLAATAKAPVALLGADTARDLGVEFGRHVTVATHLGAVTVPAREADLPPGVVWLPAHSPGCSALGTLGAWHGAVVDVRPGEEVQAR
jgi:NADH-quinone oxidoreductase subunit G